MPVQRFGGAASRFQTTTCGVTERGEGKVGDRNLHHTCYAYVRSTYQPPPHILPLSPQLANMKVDGSFLLLVQFLVLLAVPIDAFTLSTRRVNGGRQQAKGGLAGPYQPVSRNAAQATVPVRPETTLDTVRAMSGGGGEGQVGTADIESCNSMYSNSWTPSTQSFLRYVSRPPSQAQV